MLLEKLISLIIRQIPFLLSTKSNVFVTSYIVNWISAAKFLVYNGNKIFYNSNQRHLCVIGNNLHNKEVFCRHEMSAVCNNQT